MIQKTVSEGGLLNICPISAAILGVSKVIPIFALNMVTHCTPLSPTSWGQFCWAKSSSLAVGLDVKQFITIIAINFVTLCCATLVQSRCFTNLPLIVFFCTFALASKLGVPNSYQYLLWIWSHFILLKPYKLRSVLPKARAQPQLWVWAKL